MSRGKLLEVQLTVIIFHCNISPQQAVAKRPATECYDRARRASREDFAPAWCKLKVQSEWLTNDQNHIHFIDVQGIEWNRHQ